MKTRGSTSTPVRDSDAAAGCGCDPSALDRLAGEMRVMRQAIKLAVDAAREARDEVRALRAERAAATDGDLRVHSPPSPVAVYQQQPAAVETERSPPPLDSEPPPAEAESSSERDAEGRQRDLLEEGIEGARKKMFLLDNALAIGGPLPTVHLPQMSLRPDGRRLWRNMIRRPLGIAIERIDASDTSIEAKGVNVFVKWGRSDTGGPKWYTCYACNCTLKLHEGELTFSKVADELAHEAVCPATCSLLELVLLDFEELLARIAAQRPELTTLDATKLAAAEHLHTLLCVYGVPPAVAADVGPSIGRSKRVMDRICYLRNKQKVALQHSGLLRPGERVPRRPVSKRMSRDHSDAVAAKRRAIARSYKAAVPGEDGDDAASRLTVDDNAETSGIDVLADCNADPSKYQPYPLRVVRGLAPRRGEHGALEAAAPNKTEQEDDALPPSPVAIELPKAERFLRMHATGAVVMDGSRHWTFVCAQCGRRPMLVRHGCGTVCYRLDEWIEPAVVCYCMGHTLPQLAAHELAAAVRTRLAAMPECDPRLELARVMKNVEAKMLADTSTRLGVNVMLVRRALAAMKDTDEVLP